MASCITFTPPERVPPGNEYHVGSSNCGSFISLLSVLLQPGMYLNGYEASEFKVFVYNHDQGIVIIHDLCKISRVILNLYSQVFIPNELETFGSSYKQLRRSSSTCAYYMYIFNIYISKSYVKALDKPSRRCTSKTKSPNTTKCLASFIERELGCSPNIQGSRYPDGIPCNNKSQLEGLADITRIFRNSDGNEIYGMTGCLSACEKDEYALLVDPTEKVINEVRSTSCEYHVKFQITQPSFEEKEQYVIYDIDSFFADIGGYMGLLLGCSLMSLYSELEALLKKLFCRSHGSGKSYIC